MSTFADCLFTYPFFHNNWGQLFDKNCWERLLFSEWRDAAEDDASEKVHKGFLNTWYDKADWSVNYSFDHSLLKEISPISDDQERLLCDLCEYC